MAKIYQTQIDLDRERLSKEAKEDRDSQTVGLTWLATGLVLLGFGFLRKPVPEISPLPNASFWKGIWDGIKEGPNLKFLGGIVTFWGAIDTFRFSKKAKKAEAELAKLGPEEVIVPPGANLELREDGPHVIRLKESCGCHKVKSL